MRTFALSVVSSLAIVSCHEPIGYQLFDPRNQNYFTPRGDMTRAQIRARFGSTTSHSSFSHLPPAPPRCITCEQWEDYDKKDKTREVVIACFNPELTDKGFVPRSTDRLCSLQFGSKTEGCHQSIRQAFSGVETCETSEESWTTLFGPSS